MLERWLSAARVDPAEWAARSELTPAEIDCVTAVMLKNLDGKCKMGRGEKRIMTALYDAVGEERSGDRLGDAFHSLIETARAAPDPPLLAWVFEQRVLAETMISRPVMMAFKARLRREGVLPQSPETSD